MRRLLGVAGVVAALAWAGSASAQSALNWGPPTGSLQYRVVSTGASKVPSAMPATQSGKSGFGSFFAKLNPFAKKTSQAAPALPKRGQVSGKSGSLMPTGFGQ
jgi:hypothetical protein